MNKNIEVVDEAGNMYEPTWPKRAKGLVKHGRARFVDENRICLACPPELKAEEKRMSNSVNIFGGVTVAEILQMMSSMLTQNAHIEQALNALCKMDDGSVGAPGSPGNMQAAAKAEAIASVVKARETTNQHALQLYERMYNDMIRFAIGEVQSE